MDLDEIAYEKADGVAEIVLDRPAQRNPISARAGGTRDQILWALDDAEDDPDDRLRAAPRCRRGVLVGRRPHRQRTRARRRAEHHEFLERAEAFHARVRDARLPVVAAVHGYCLGAALQLVASCDSDRRRARTRASACPKAASAWSAPARWSRSSDASGRSSSSSPAS